MSKSIEPVTSAQFSDIVKDEVGGVINLIGDYQSIVNEDSVNTALKDAKIVSEDLTQKHSKVNSILADAELHSIHVNTIIDNSKAKVEELTQEAALEEVTIKAQINEVKSQLVSAEDDVVSVKSALEVDVSKAKTQNDVAISTVIETAEANRVTTLQEAEQKLIARHNNYSVEAIKSATADLEKLRDVIEKEAEGRVKELEESHAKNLKSVEVDTEKVLAEYEDAFTTKKAKLTGKLSEAKTLLNNVRAETAELKATYNKLVEAV